MHSTTVKIPEDLSKSTMVPIIHKKRNAPNFTNAEELKCFAKVTQHRTKQYFDRALQEDRDFKMHRVKPKCSSISQTSNTHFSVESKSRCRNIKAIDEMCRRNISKIIKYRKECRPTCILWSSYLMICIKYCFILYWKQ